MKMTRTSLLILAASICITLHGATIAGAATTNPPSASSEPHLGVYRWPNGMTNVDAFAAWLGRPVVWGEDFVGGESWDNVAWPVWWLKAWSAWVHEKPGRRLILAIPLLAGPPDGSGPKQGNTGVNQPVSLEKGAHGEYNPLFKKLAENLVEHQLADTILRPGWEFNGGWYAWRAKGKTREFAEYWRQIVRTMRAVPGTEKLQFCWNPTLGYQDFPAEQAWPGDEFVDLVGLDVYDETWQAGTYPWPASATDAEIEERHKKVWREWTFGSDHGLKFWRDFAAAHHKPLVIPEWGVKLQNTAGQEQHGGLDDAYFVEQMHAFVTDPANRVFFHCYFDVNCNPPKGRHQLSPGVNGTDRTDFPKSAAKFRALFGARK
ncbi:MAG: hypothetical protein HY301_12795 [Verrucomicrobia bacterium]|nr:hypothetical protein [Verrucomicrobiota bacterium]